MHVGSGQHSVRWRSWWGSRLRPRRSRSPTPLTVPTSMAALGDSITIAYDVTKLLTAQPEYSWSTGTSTSVQSVYTRLKKRRTASWLAKANYAVSGAKMSDLAGQAAVPMGTVKGKELVTILMGANDACTNTDGGHDGMSRPSGAGSRLRCRALLPQGSRPGGGRLDPRHLQAVGGRAGRSSSARFVWGLYGICQSMLKSPIIPRRTRTSPAADVRARVVAFNQRAGASVLGVETAVGHDACRFDGNAVYDTTFALTDISKVDYFHPSVSGQATLAAVTYSAFGFPQ